MKNPKTLNILHNCETYAKLTLSQKIFYIEIQDVWLCQKYTFNQYQF